MDKNESLDLCPSERHRLGRLGKLSDVMLRVARQRVLIYILISATFAAGSHFIEVRHRHDIQKAVYNNCTQQELIKAQANQRIDLIKQAQKAIIFKTAKDKLELALAVERVQPLPRYDCSHLRPNK